MIKKGDNKVIEKVIKKKGDKVIKKGDKVIKKVIKGDKKKVKR